MKKIITLFTGLLMLVSCQKKTATTKQIEEKVVIKNFYQKTEIAHKKQAFLANEAIQFDAAVSFGGNEIFNATISVATTSEYALIEKKDGSKIYINKDKIFASPALEKDASVRFHAYTWTYFFLLPYKLDDQGTKWNFNYKTKETTNTFNTAKLSFKENTGDAPQDWYVMYTNKETNILEQAAYIVTAHKAKADAEKDPHGIKYEDYTLLSGIPIANNWSFWGWNETDGFTTQIGAAKITNIKFIKGFKEKFKTIPSNYIKK